MIRIITITLFLVMSMVTTTSMAQAEHGHSHGPEITEDEAKLVASGIVRELAENNKIDTSWNKTEVTSISKKTFDGHLEWVITFQNDTIEDQAKRTLYIFLTPGGEFTGANHTGE